MDRPGSSPLDEQPGRKRRKIDFSTGQGFDTQHEQKSDPQEQAGSKDSSKQDMQDYAQALRNLSAKLQREEATDQLPKTDTKGSIQQDGPKYLRALYERIGPPEQEIKDEDAQQQGSGENTQIQPRSEDVQLPHSGDHQEEKGREGDARAMPKEQGSKTQGRFSLQETLRRAAQVRQEQDSSKQTSPQEEALIRDGLIDGSEEV